MIAILKMDLLEELELKETKKQDLLIIILIS